MARIHGPFDDGSEDDRTDDEPGRRPSWASADCGHFATRGKDTMFYELSRTGGTRSATLGPAAGAHGDQVDFQVRSAEPADAAALSELAVRAKSHWGYPEGWIRHWKRDLTLTPQYLAANAAFVATCAGAIVGMAALHVQEREASLEHVWIAPEYHGRGIGRALVQRALAAAAVAG